MALRSNCLIEPGKVPAFQIKHVQALLQLFLLVNYAFSHSQNKLNPFYLAYNDQTYIKIIVNLYFCFMHLLPPGCRSNLQETFCRRINNHHLSRVCVDAYVVRFNVLGLETAKGEETSGKKLVFSFFSWAADQADSRLCCPSPVFRHDRCVIYGAKYE